MACRFPECSPARVGKGEVACFHWPTLARDDVKSNKVFSKLIEHLQVKSVEGAFQALEERISRQHCPRDTTIRDLDFPIPLNDAQDLVIHAYRKSLGPSNLWVILWAGITERGVDTPRP